MCTLSDTRAVFFGTILVILIILVNSNIREDIHQFPQTTLKLAEALRIVISQQVWLFLASWCMEKRNTAKIKTAGT